MGNDKGDHDEVLMVKAIILKLGSQRFGPPNPEIREKLEQLMELSHLKDLCVRLFTVQSWSDLLGLSNY